MNGIRHSQKLHHLLPREQNLGDSDFFETYFFRTALGRLSRREAGICNAVIF